MRPYDRPPRRYAESDRCLDTENTTHRLWTQSLCHAWIAGTMSVRKRAQVLRTFGARVRKHRLARGLTQEGLAEATGLHWTYVGSVERGERNVSLVNIVRLSQALHADSGELIAGLRL
jgi:ribosome-binding protein aMBF1 (putative translation factor)